MLAWNPPARFAGHAIAGGLKGGYQVAAVDVNGDGRPDLIALASGTPELVWFENPGWQRHVIAGGFTNLINFAAWDFNGDGVPEIVVASGFSMDARKSPGIVHVVEHQGNVRGPWRVREIDRLPTSHRLRVADFDGRGKVIVNAPLTGAAAEPPDYRGRTPLVYYRPGAWTRHLISEQNEGVVHGLDVLDWDGDGRDEILTASFTGLHLFRYGRDGRWTRTELAKGDPAAWPKSGASEVAVGQLGKDRYLASIEPWHGHQVVVYLERGGRRERLVIDDSFVEGHTLRTADLNGDGRDEIVAGYRGKGHAVYVYYAEDARGERWARHQLDDGVAASSCAVADLNGDGRLDLACIGGSTANLKWYENAGSAAAP